MKRTLKESKIFLTMKYKTIIYKSHLGLLKNLKRSSKQVRSLNKNPSLQDKLCNIQEHHPKCLHVFTDNSMDNNKTCVAILNQKIVKKKKKKRKRKNSFKRKIYLFRWNPYSRQSTENNLWKQPQNILRLGFCLIIARKILKIWKIP